MEYADFTWTFHAQQQAEIRGISDALAKEAFEYGSYYSSGKGNYKIKYQITTENVNKQITFVISKGDRKIITCYVDTRSINKLMDKTISDKKYVKKFLRTKRDAYKSEFYDEQLSNYRKGTFNYENQTRLCE